MLGFASLELPPEMIAPTRRQSFKGDGPAQRFNIILLSRIEASDISYRDVILVARDQRNVVSGFHLAFALNGEIEPGAAAGQKSSNDVCPAKLDTEFVAGHTRLGDGYLG